MSTLKEAANNFLALKVIAVAGVSSASDNAASSIYTKLKNSGYQVFPVNPRAQSIGADPCYGSLHDIPAAVEGVVIGTPPQATLSVLQECAELGIRNAWIHRSVDNGSYVPEAEAFCREKGIKLIPGGCPMMFCSPVDFPHKCMRWVLNISGKLPKNV